MSNLLLLDGNQNAYTGVFEIRGKPSRPIVSHRIALSYAFGDSQRNTGKTKQPPVSQRLLIACFSYGINPLRLKAWRKSKFLSIRINWPRENPKTRYPTAPYLLLVFGEIGRDFSAFGRDFPTHMDRRNFLTTLALLVPGASLLAKSKPTPPRPPVPCPEPHAAEARNEA